MPASVPGIERPPFNVFVPRQRVPPIRQRPISGCRHTHKVDSPPAGSGIVERPIEPPGFPGSRRITKHLRPSLRQDPRRQFLPLP